MKWRVGVSGHRTDPCELSRNDRLDLEDGSSLRVPRDPNRIPDGYIELEGKVNADSSTEAIAKTCSMLTQLGGFDPLKDLFIEVDR